LIISDDVSILGGSAHTALQENAETLGSGW